MTDSLAVYKEQVAQELLAIAADPNSTMEEVKNTLGGVYFAAEGRGDTETMEFTLAVMDNVESLVKLADHAMTLAAAAKQTAADMLEQRDQVASDFAELKDAVNTVDTTNEMVQGLYESLVDDAYEQAFDDAEEQLVMGWEQGQDFAAQIANGFLDGIVSESTAITFWEYLDGSDLTEAETDELGAWINTFVEKVSQRIAAQTMQKKFQAIQELDEWNKQQAKGA